jgi:hypothetical protein
LAITTACGSVIRCQISSSARAPRALPESQAAATPDAGCPGAQAAAYAEREDTAARDGRASRLCFGVYVRKTKHNRCKRVSWHIARMRVALPHTRGSTQSRARAVGARADTLPLAALRRSSQHLAHS